MSFNFRHPFGTKEGESGSFAGNRESRRRDPVNDLAALYMGISDVLRGDRGYGD
jgi:hypothetical protein